MTYLLSFHPKAELEYDEAYNWHNNEKAGLGEKFFHAIDKKIQQILIGPELYSVKNNSCREAIVNGFSFYYRIQSQYEK